MSAARFIDFPQMARSFLAVCLCSATIASSAYAQSPAPISDVPAVLTILAEAENDGLPAVPIASIEDDLKSSDAYRSARGQERLLAAVRDYLQAESGRRINPSQINSDWRYKPLALDIDQAIEDANGTVAPLMRETRSKRPGYAALSKERMRYAAFVQRGGWAALPKSARDAAIRSRLAAEGYSGAQTDLAAALRLFQERHGLEATGTLSKETRAAFDVSAEARLRQLDMTLERERWLPRTLPANRIEVNVAAAGVELFESNQEPLHMRAVVGSAKNKTPIFSADLTSIVLNPTWTVPDSIARQEILPKAAADPAYLKRHGYSYVGSSLVQTSGPGNALGAIKFDLPNPYAIYLHDTPNKALFARAIRTLSHGCVRIADPLGLAERLTAPLGIKRGEIEGVIASGQTQRITLISPLPVFIVYRTAFIGEDGEARFAADPYGWDKALDDALRAKGVKVSSVAKPRSTERSVSVAPRAG